MSESYGWEGQALTFQERMEAAKDSVRAELHRSDGRLKAAVNHRRPALVRSMSVQEVARLHGLSDTAVKALCAAGRVQGARRLRTGKGRPWVIPLPLVVLPGSRGPKSRFTKSESSRVPF